MKRFTIFAHRGASAVAPENTMAAFNEALVQGADGIECDIQFTADHLPVIIHDDFLERTTNGHGMVQDYTFEQLQELSAGSWFHTKYKNERIPSLNRLLSWLKNTSLLLNIELKTNIIYNNLYIKTVIDYIRQHQLVKRTVISSYDLKILEQVRIIEPKIETALLYFYLHEPWKNAEEAGASKLHPFSPFLTQEVAIKAKNAGFGIIPYTVDDWPEFSRLIQLQVDGVITNYPKRIYKYLESLQLRPS